MGRTSSITMPCMVGIVGRAPAVDQKVLCFFTGRPARSATMPVLFLLSGPKMGFSLRRATLCPDKCEIWHGGADRIYRGRYVEIQPQKLSKFRILAINFSLRGHSFVLFLRHCQILYASQGGF